MFVRAYLLFFGASTEASLFVVLFFVIDVICKSYLLSALLIGVTSSRPLLTRAQELIGLMRLRA